MPDKKWKLNWREDFAHGSRPNRSVWSHEVGYVRNNEKQFYTDRSGSNCRVENNQLVLEAKKEPINGYNYSSASITTKGKKEFLYGKLEIVAKLPTGKGIWPAIWLLGADVDEIGWPLCGEIDIMEFVGYDPVRIHGNVHTQAYNHTKETNQGNNTTSSTLATDFHNYSIVWTKDNLQFLMDDDCYFQFENDRMNNVETWPFDRPHFLLINLAVGGFWGGKMGIDNSIFPQKFIVESISYFEAMTEE
jgi:beta-glucanase (GH16 family)